MMIGIRRAGNYPPGYYYLDVEETEGALGDTERHTFLMTAPEVTILADQIKELGF